MISPEQWNLKKLYHFHKKCDKNDKIRSYGSKIVKIRNSKLILPILILSLPPPPHKLFWFCEGLSL
jgi:hypothetical protein